MLLVLDLSRTNCPPLLGHVSLLPLFWAWMWSLAVMAVFESVTFLYGLHYFETLTANWRWEKHFYPQLLQLSTLPPLLLTAFLVIWSVRDESEHQTDDCFLASFVVCRWCNKMCLHMQIFNHKIYNNCLVYQVKVRIWSKTIITIKPTK